MGAATILHLEDSPLDAELIHTRLAGAAPPPAVDWVADRPAYLARLSANRYDLILADYQVPGFAGLDALDLAAARQPGVPFIYLSGALGEEVAIETLKRGATDYVLKSRLARLVPAVERAVAEARERAERLAAEQRLREKEERLAMLVGHATDYAVVITDQDGTVVEWAGGAEPITGWAAAEAVGGPLGVFFAPDDRTHGVPAALLAAAARDGRAEGRRWHRRKDGTPFYGDGVVTALVGDDGARRGFGMVVRDLTARKRDEERLRLLWDAAAVLLASDDPGALMRGVFDRLRAPLGVDVYLNYAATDGHSALRLASHGGVTDEVAAAARELEPGQGLCGRVVRDQKPLAAADLQTSTDPGAALLRGAGVRAYACFPLASGGRLLGTLSFGSRTRARFAPEDLGLLETIAHYVAAAYDRLRLIDQLREADRRKDEFLATLAHELRNPLAPVQNGLELIRVSPDRDVRERARAMMERQLRYMIRLIDDLLDVSRITRGRLVLRTERVDLATVLGQAVETARPGITAGGHELTVSLPPAPVALEGDPVRLCQVFANLLNNAAKYTPDGGHIRVDVGPGDGHVEVRVSDTGIGIRPDMLAVVFDLFSQADASLPRAQGGLGIGLTMVQRLAELHGGSVSAHSAGEGRGSTFVVRLPLAPAAPPAPPRAADAPHPHPGPSGRAVLVVDDNRDAADSLAVLLSTKGYDVRVANDGGEALRVLTTYRPDLVFLDIGLPGIDGYEVARRIRQTPELRDVVLVALTGWGQEEDRRLSHEAGLDYHLVKPADPAELWQILGGIVDARPA